ncbi:hypothetical protein RR48_02491 [Papilio machaon]|uniref:Uncharacterized protein n=1 Tax=Papilio machaon TaxID=76193 RepID=A0A0N1PGU6_PAPMA|nr:hypothetical protein RR48_02491 [Papilio machaon]
MSQKGPATKTSSLRGTTKGRAKKAPSPLQILQATLTPEPLDWGSPPSDPRTDDEWSDTDSINSGRDSFLPPSGKRTGVRMDLATQRANELLQAGKTALETAGNMKKEYKSETQECLQSLYEIVLSLSDSRARHKVALEQEKVRAARELLRCERAHDRQISELQESFATKLKEARDSANNTLQIVEGIRSWLNYELDTPLKTISVCT